MPSTMIELSAEYYQLWKVADAMDQLLKNIGVDFCGGNCGGTCPICVARKRFAPQRPCVVLRTTVLER